MTVNTIYAYYEEFGNPQEPPLIEYWKQRWTREGWTPVILGRKDTKRHPKSEALEVKIKTFLHYPGMVNFSRANMRRWLAFAQIDGAVADYDVFPLRPFPPFDFDGFVAFDGCGGPGFTVGTKSDFETMVDAIIGYVTGPQNFYKGIPHVCDMIITRAIRSRYKAVTDEIRCYGIRDWETRPLTHFGNHYMRPYTEMSRVDQVRAVLEKIYP